MDRIYSILLDALKQIALAIAASLLVAFVFLSWLMPLPGYVSRVSSSIVAHGLSKETWREFSVHSDWLMRYFNGPPSDSTMIRYLSAHRNAFERIAVLEIMGKCREDENSISNGRRPDGECGKLMQLNDLWAGPAMESFPNTVYRLGASGQVAHTDAVQISRQSIEPQAWRSTNRRIRYWEKSYVYVPDLIATDRVSDNPLDLFKLNNLVTDSLDHAPKAIDIDPYLHRCAVRRIDANWFIKLCAVPAL